MAVRKIVIAAIMLLFSIFAVSQEVSNQVLVPAGKVLSKGSVYYQQSVGEPAVEIFGMYGKVLTQGFQQPLVKVEGTVDPGTGIQPYPNPVTDYLNIKLWGQEPREFRITIWNLQGVTLYDIKREYIQPYTEILEVPVSKFPVGIYLLRVYSKDGVQNRSFKFEKL
ncbi:MAG: T9SS type A sorting domain-containing protein [Bacteroidales bacterium]